VSRSAHKATTRPHLGTQMATNNKPTQDLEALVTFAHEAQKWIAAHILKR